MFSTIVAKVSLSISIITFSILVIMISIIMIDSTDNYEAFIQSQIITHKNMPYAIGIAGLLLVLLSSLISWFISLYGSFKIAGPLYRFSQNLRHCHNSDKMLALRADDCLQDLSHKIIKAAKHTETHKHNLLLQIEQCQKLLTQVENDNRSDSLSAALQQLKSIDGKAKLEAFSKGNLNE